MNLYLRFFRHGGIFRSDVGCCDLESLGRGAASRWSAPGQATSGRHGRNTPCSSSTMSSGRLFLDRVARIARLRFTGTLILKPFRDRAQ
jgi:hypothetical protein